MRSTAKNESTSLALIHEDFQMIKALGVLLAKRLALPPESFDPPPWGGVCFFRIWWMWESVKNEI